MSLLVLPPGPVSDRTEVELRAAVEPGARPVMTFAGRALDVRVDDAGLASAWASTAGVRGSVEARCGDDAVLVEVVPCETRALPRFGAFWLDGHGVLGYRRRGTPSADDARAMLRGMHALGASLVIFTYVEYGGAFYYPSDIEFSDRDIGGVARGTWADFDVLGTVFDEADRLGLGVVVGLGRGGDTPLLWEFDAPDWGDRNAFALDLGARVADEVWARYGHHRSFSGWYLTHEMNDLARASAYYDPLARHCRSKAPQTFVMVAPAGTPVITPDDLKRSEVDAFAYQDAVGAGYVPNVYTWDPEQRLAQLREVYQSYRELHDGSGKHLWSDLELWEMDGSQGYSNAYPPAWDRVRRQLEVEAPLVDFITGYEYGGFVEGPGAAAPLEDDRARVLFAALAEHGR